MSQSGRTHSCETCFAILVSLFFGSEFGIRNPNAET